MVVVSWAVTVGGSVDNGTTVYRAKDDMHVHAQKFDHAVDDVHVHLHAPKVDRAVKDVRLIEAFHASANDALRRHRSWAPWDGPMLWRLGQYERFYMRMH
jgi:hypothetical protein